MSYERKPKIEFTPGMPGNHVQNNHSCRMGFTLIELSITIVIIGLITGSILIGRDLINAAMIRAQVSQIEGYQTAVNSFKLKYGYLPGDLPKKETIALFGELPGYTYGNGDGILQGYWSITDGEFNRFWVQLAKAGMIEGNFRFAGTNTDTNVSGKVSYYLPYSKLGGNQYIYVWSGGPDPCHNAATCFGNNGKNYFSIGEFSRYCGYNPCGSWGSDSTIPVIIAYHIDKKMDDGMPQSGRVQAFSFTRARTAGAWAGTEYRGMGLHGPRGTPTTSANPRGPQNCYDNNNKAGQPQQYSTATNGGNNLTCALSFEFK